MNMLLGILLILLCNFVPVQLQDNIFTFSRNESVCIGETVTLTCYVYPPAGEGFSSLAELSFNGSANHDIAFINNPTNGLTAIGYSATGDTSVIPAMGDSARIQLTISSYQVSDSNTIFAGYGIFDNNGSSIFVIQSPGPSIAGPPTAVSLSVSLTSLTPATCSGVVRVAWTPGASDRPILSYALSLDGATLGTFSPSVTSNDSSLSVATDVVYRYSVTASSCAGSSIPSYGASISVQSYSLVSSPLFLSYDKSTSMITVDWGLVPRNEPLLLVYSLLLNYSQSQHGTTYPYSKSSSFSLISGTSIYSVPLTPHGFSTPDGVVTNITACIAIASQCGTAFSGDMICGFFNSENPPTTTQPTTPTVTVITSTPAIVSNATTDGSQSTLSPTLVPIDAVNNLSGIIIGISVAFILMSIFFLSIITILVVVIVYLLRKIKHLQSLPKEAPHSYEYIDLNIVSPLSPDTPSPPKDSAYYSHMQSVGTQNTSDTHNYANLK